MRPRIAGLSSFYRDSRLDQFINFSLKYNQNIPEWFRNASLNLGNYYTWICDMENFDYANFNPEWLSAHFTLYYKRYFRHSKTLQSHLLKVIKEKDEKDLSKRFIHIYSYND